MDVAKEALAGKVKAGGIKEWVWFEHLPWKE